MNHESRGLQSHQSDERVLGPELECEDAVAEVVPVNNDLAATQLANEVHEGEGRYTGWVLPFCVSLSTSLWVACETVCTWTTMNSGRCRMRRSRAEMIVIIWCSILKGASKMEGSLRRDAGGSGR